MNEGRKWLSDDAWVSLLSMKVESQKEIMSSSQCWALCKNNCSSSLPLIFEGVATVVEKFLCKSTFLERVHKKWTKLHTVRLLSLFYVDTAIITYYYYYHLLTLLSNLLTYSCFLCFSTASQISRHPCSGAMLIFPADTCFLSFNWVHTKTGKI